MYEYEGVRRVVYGEGASFVPVCICCGRFVSPNDDITFDSNGQPVGNTAVCKKCGPSTMPFEGWI